MRKNVLKIIAMSMLFICNYISAQSFKIDATNTTLSCTFSYEVYDNSSTLLFNGVLTPGSNFSIGCRTGLPAYVIFRENAGACQVQINVNSNNTWPGAGGVCSCPCMSGGTNFKVDLTPSSGCLPPPVHLLKIETY